MEGRLKSLSVVSIGVIYITLLNFWLSYK